MNKNQITMSVIGGVALVATLAIAYFIYAESDTRAEQEDTLNAQKSIFEKNRKSSREQEKSVKDNAAAVEAWTASAFADAAGLTNAVRYAERMTPAGFKEQMLRDVRRYQSVPADSKVKIVAEGDAMLQSIFPDFKDYITAGQMPDRPDLQRQWGDTCLFIDTLLECGAQNVVSVKVDTPPPPPPPEEGRGRGRDEGAKPDPFDVQTYTIVFNARPAALTGVLNALAKVERFVSVDVLSFAQEPDPLLGVLNVSGKKEGAEGGRRRNRRRQAEEAAAENAEAEQLARSGTVTNPADPLICTPFKVTMTVSTLAVRRAAPGKEEE